MLRGLPVLLSTSVTFLSSPRCPKIDEQSKKVSKKNIAPSLEEEPNHHGEPCTVLESSFPSSSSLLSYMALGPPSDSVRLASYSILYGAGATRSISSHTSPTVWEENEDECFADVVSKKSDAWKEQKEEPSITPSASFEMEELSQWACTFQQLSKGERKQESISSPDDNLFYSMDSDKEGVDGSCESMGERERSSPLGECKKPPCSVPPLEGTEERSSTDRKEVPRLVPGNLPNALHGLSSDCPFPFSSFASLGGLAVQRDGIMYHERETHSHCINGESHPLPTQLRIAFFSRNEKQKVESSVRFSVCSNEKAGKKVASSEERRHSPLNDRHLQHPAPDAAPFDPGRTPCIFSSLVGTISSEPRHRVFMDTKTCTPAAAIVTEHSSSLHPCVRRTTLRPSTIKSPPNVVKQLIPAPTEGPLLSGKEDEDHSLSVVESPAARRVAARKVQRVVGKKKAQGSYSDTSPVFPSSFLSPSFLKVGNDLSSSDPSPTSEPAVMGSALSPTSSASSLSSLSLIPPPELLLCAPRWEKKESSKRFKEASPKYFNTAISYYHQLYSSLLSAQLGLHAIGHRNGVEEMLFDFTPVLQSSESCSNASLESPCGVLHSSEHVYLFLLSLAYAAIAEVHSDGLLFLLEYSSTAPACTANLVSVAEERTSTPKEELFFSTEENKTTIVLPSAACRKTVVKLAEHPVSSSYSGNRRSCKSTGRTDPQDTSEESGNTCLLECNKTESPVTASMEKGKETNMFIPDSVGEGVTPSPPPNLVFLAIVEALLLRLCERAIELSSKHLVHLTGMLPSLLHGMLSCWEERNQGHCFLNTGAEEKAKSEINKGSTVASSAASVVSSFCTKKTLSQTEESDFQASLLAFLQSSKPSLLHSLFSSPSILATSSTTFSSSLTKYVQSGVSAHQRIGKLLHHTMFWCCYVNRQSLRRVQNVHCLQSLILASLLPPSRNPDVLHMEEHHLCETYNEGEKEDIQKQPNPFHANDNDKKKRERLRRRDRKRSGEVSNSKKRVHQEGSVISDFTASTASSTVFSLGSPVSSGNEGCPPVRHALSHLLMRYITAKEVDNLSETTSSKDITYLPQFAVTHCWNALFPEVRSAAVLWVQKHKMKSKDSIPSSTKAFEPLSSTSASSRGSGFFLSPLPSFLNSVRPSKPPREVFSRLTRLTQDSHHFSVPIWDAIYLAFLRAENQSRVPQSNKPLAHQKKAKTRNHHQDDGGRHQEYHVGSGDAESTRPPRYHRVPQGMGLHNGMLQEGGETARQRPVSVHYPFPISPHRSTSFVSSNAVTNEQVEHALNHLSVARGETYLRSLSLLHEQLLPYHPSPSVFAGLVQGRHPTLSGVLVRHIIYREWPRIVSSMHVNLFSLESKEALVIGNEALKNSSFSLSLCGGVGDTNAAPGPSGMIPSSLSFDRFSAIRSVLSALWLLLRRVNILEVSRDILWLLPVLSGGSYMEKYAASCLTSVAKGQYPPCAWDAADSEKMGHQSSTPNMNSSFHPLQVLPPVEVLAVIRCVVSHIPPSLVHLVLQQVVEMREMAALPLHPYVLHFLVALVKTLREKKWDQSFSFCCVSNVAQRNKKVQEGTLPSEYQQEQEHRERSEGDAVGISSTLPMPSLIFQDVGRTTTEKSQSNREPHTKETLSHPLMHAINQPETRYECMISEVRGLIRRLAAENLSHNRYYHRENIKDERHFKSSNMKVTERWWETEAYFSLWEQLDRILVSPYPLSCIPFDVITTEGWSVRDEWNESDEEGGKVFSDDIKDENHTSSNPHSEDTKVETEEAIMRLPLPVSRPSFATRTTTPISSDSPSCKANVENVNGNKEDGDEKLLERAITNKNVKDCSTISFPSFLGKSGTDLWQYWGSLCLLINYPEAEVRLCTVMAAKQRKILLLPNRKQREKIWVLELDSLE